MQLSQSLPRILAVSGLAAVLACNVALAQTKGASTPQEKGAKSEYTPTVGQEGKDVVWVPTPQALVERMLDMARVTKDDFVTDLGSGDGRTVITAAKRGVRAKGIEYNPDMVELSKRNAAKEGVGDKVELVRGDIFESDFSNASVITLFLLPSLNQRLRPIILNMKPGTRVVSNTFDMGDWQADEQIQATGDCTSYCRAYFWMVPAKVSGKWKTPEGELTLDQRYQILSGQLSNNNQHAQVQGKVIGDRIVFTAGRALFDGKVNGDSIEGTLDDSGDKKTIKLTR
ncbi:MAG: methyltransferase domain-containing protein [Bradyrhizobiaceae bacterium]|nr:methyltransferase domain-containing protein [Bradyrhizobiaceae bacterium]